MFCKECGNKIDSDSKYCSFCGFKLKSAGNQMDNQDIELKLNDKVNIGTVHEPSYNFRSNNISKAIKYDTTYVKESEATVVGFIFLIVNTIIYSFDLKVVLEEESTFISLLFVGMFFRIIFSIWSIKIASRLNRNELKWGALTFFFPSISLIIIGLLKKIYKEPKQFVSDSVKSIKVLTRKTVYDKILMIETNLELGYTIGDTVKIDGLIAEDGKYKFGFMDYIEIANGKIIKL